MIHKKIVIVYDCTEDNNDKFWLGSSIKKLVSDNVTEIYSKKQSIARIKNSGKFGGLKATFEMLRICFSTIKNSSKGDLVLIWGNQQALMFNELISILHIKRQIVSFGWLNPRKGKIAFLRKKCLKNRNFIALTNSKKGVDDWKRIYELPNANVLYFPDSYDIRDKFIKYSVKDDKYVFSGGFSSRDWKRFLQIVSKLPHIKFKCIAHKNQWNKEWMIPKNLEVKFNTSTTEYYDELKNAYCSIFVCTPNVNAGLINVMKSIQYSVIPLVTYNESIMEYYSNYGNDYLIKENDVNLFVKNIIKVYSLSEFEYRKIMDNLQENLQRKFNGEKLIQELFYSLERML